MQYVALIILVCCLFALCSKQSDLGVFISTALLIASFCVAVHQKLVAEQSLKLNYEKTGKKVADEICAEGSPRHSPSGNNTSSAPTRTAFLSTQAQGFAKTPDHIRHLRECRSNDNDDTVKDKIAHKIDPNY